MKRLTVPPNLGVTVIWRAPVTRAMFWLRDVVIHYVHVSGRLSEVTQGITVIQPTEDKQVAEIHFNFVLYDEGKIRFTPKLFMEAVNETKKVAFPDLHVTCRASTPSTINVPSDITDIGIK